jgi:HSP20 family molecular chaperone IbpA
LSSSNNFDENFGGFDMFNSNFGKKIQKMMEEIDRAVKSGNLKGNWKIDRIETPEARGYVVRGHFGSKEPFEPFEPLNPFDPVNPKRRPVPQRLFKIPQSALKEVREPLADVFEEEKSTKIYIELPGENKDDIQLNVTAGKVEVKAKNFYKMIDLPTSNIDYELASSKYKNGVLEVIIPKKEKTSEKDTHKIEIE